MKYGILLQVFSAFCLLAFSFEVNLFAIFISMIFYVGSLGFIFGNAMGLALDFFKKDTGVANSVIGVTQFAIAGVIGFIASLVHTGELSAIFIMMLITALCALLSLRLSK